MTLATMRSLVRTYILDPAAEYLGDAALDPLINAGLRHVANWADSQDQALFVTQATVSSVGGSVFTEVPFYGSGFTLGDTVRFRRLLSVTRTNHSSGTVGLQVISAEEWRQYDAGATETPACYVAGQKLVLVNAASGINLRMEYVHSLPDMTVGSDTPGQASGSGTANLLPEDYQPLVPIYAATLALGSESSDAQFWRDTYIEMRDGLLQTLQQRRGARRGQA